MIPKINEGGVHASNHGVYHEKLIHDEYGLRARRYEYGLMNPARRSTELIPCLRSQGANAR